MLEFSQLRQLDESLLLAVNGLAHRSFVADRIIMLASESYLVKAAPVVACLWWSWFAGAAPDRKLQHRIAAFAGIAGGLCSVVITRSLQNFLPARPRPIHTAGLETVVPFGIPTDMLRNWSSFPSDTAALMFALATAVWLRSRTLGVVALLWVAAIGVLPRVFAGYHYPSDVLAGGLIGITTVVLVARLPATADVVRRLGRFEAQYQGIFCALAFLVCYQVTNSLTDVRSFALGLGEYLERSRGAEAASQSARLDVK